MSGWLLVALAAASVGDRRGNSRPLPADVPSVVSEDGRFRVHWSLDPDLAPEGAEGDAIPPGVAVVFDAIAVAEEAYRLRGYVPVTGDDGTGGDEALDLYFLPIDANGYAYPLRGQSPEGGAACYIELDAGLRGNLLASVVQHELHHCVQFRYTTRANGWIYEASATWEQYQLASESLDLGLQLLYGTRLAEPDRPLDDRGDRYEYAGFLVFKHIDEFRRTEPRSAAVWEALAQDPDWQVALDRVATDAFDLDLAEWFAAYSTYNAFACGLSDGQHYDEANAGCTTPTTIPLTELTLDTPVDVVLSDSPLTSMTFEVPTDGLTTDVEWVCDAPTSGQWVTTLIPVHADGTAGTAVRTDALADAGRVRTQGGVVSDGSVRVVVASVGDEALAVRCVARPVALDAETGCSTTGSSLPLRWAWLVLLTALGTRGRPRRR